uniref:Ubiquitin-conjugating enzyme E2 J2 n=1 Tax=Clastoptera arizonana TaxID=38151 RepID=A0A1B6C965_9HEMI
MSNRKPICATSRLKQDYLRLKKDPVPYVVAEPVPSNLLEWYYVVRGPENSPYEGGMYLGRLVFPREFPFKPPSIFMNTPNGRFKTNQRLCLSISDFHPDTWNPAWSVSTILTGLLSFMLEKSPTLGSIETSDYERRQLAHQSLVYNIKDRHFCELFPDLVEMVKTELERRESAELAARNNQSEITSTGPRALLREQFGNRDQSPLHGAITNLFVIIGFAAFAYTVKYVLRNIAAE